MRTFVCLVLVLATVLARQEERVEVEEEVERKEEEVEEAEEVSLSPGTTTELPGLVMVRGLRNITRDAGGSLKLRCEVGGSSSSSSSS